MDLAAIFLLSLLGGYCFAVVWRRTAFGTRRVDGHHLYFRAALFGIAFFAIAFAVRSALLNNLAYAAFDATLLDYVRPALKEETGATAAEQTRRADWVITALYSLAIGPLCAYLLNLVTPRDWALAKSLGALDKLLLDAQGQDMPVALTLNTGKVYIGLVLSTPDPTNEPAAATILPMFSGQRGDDGRIVLTTDYEPIYAQLNAGGAAALGLPTPWSSQFTLALRADTIVTASLFSPKIYAAFNPGWKQRIIDLQRPPPRPEFVVELKRRAVAGPVAPVGGPVAAAPAAPPTP